MLVCLNISSLLQSQSYFEDKNRSIDYSFGAGLVENMLVLLNIFHFRKNVNIDLTIVLTLLNPDCLFFSVESVHLRSLPCTSQHVCVFCCPASHLGPSFPFCLRSALPFFGTFWRFSTLMYKSGTLHSVFP